MSPHRPWISWVIMVSKNHRSLLLSGSSGEIILSTYSALNFTFHRIRVWEWRSPFSCYSIVVIEALSSPKIISSLTSQRQFFGFPSKTRAIISWRSLEFWFWKSSFETCKETVCSSKRSNISHCLLRSLVHISRPSYIGWMQKIESPIFL